MSLYSWGICFLFLFCFFLFFLVNPIAEKKIIQIKGSDLGFLGTWPSNSLPHEVYVKEGHSQNAHHNHKGKYSNLLFAQNKYLFWKHWLHRNYSGMLHQPQGCLLMFIWDSNPSFPIRESHEIFLVMCPCAGCRESGQLWVTAGHSWPMGCRWTKISFSSIWEIKFWTIYWGGFDGDRIHTVRKVGLLNQIHPLLKHTALSHSLLRPHLGLAIPRSCTSPRTSVGSIPSF